MKILGQLVRVRRGQLYIPWFHRVAPSLLTHTTVHCVLFSGDRSEIYLTPFPASSWIDLWRIDCEFNDRPGLLAQMTRLVGGPDIKANILAHESLTLGHERIFQVSLLCDMTAYGDSYHPDSTSPERAEKQFCRLPFLSEYLASRMAKDIKVRQGRQQLFVTRLKEFHSIGRQVNSDPGCQIFHRVIRRGLIDLGDSEWEAFAGNRTPGPDGMFLVTIASDTDERYVKVGALPADRDLFLLSITHTDTEGQIARFTSLLRESFDDSINIVCSYTRLQNSGEVAVWRCLMEVASGTVGVTKTRIQGEFRKANRAWRDGRLRVAFPDPIGEEQET